MQIFAILFLLLTNFVRHSDEQVSALTLTSAASLGSSLNCQWYCGTNPTQSCYCIVNSNTGITWTNARTLCQNDGAYLGTILTKGDEETFETLLVTYGINDAGTLTNSSRKTAWFGLQRDYFCYQSQSFGQYVWRDNCLEPKAPDPFFAYAVLNYSTSVYAYVANWPFGCCAQGCSGNTNGMLLTTDVSYGPWYDWSTTSTYATNTAVFCRREQNPCGSNPCANGGTCTNVASCFTCACPAGFTGAQCNTSVLSASVTTLTCNWTCLNTSTQSCLCVVPLNSPNVLTWTQAQNVCTAGGAMPGKILSALEEQLVEHLTRTYVPQRTTGTAVQNAWLGLQRTGCVYDGGQNTYQWYDGCMNPFVTIQADLSYAAPSYPSYYYTTTPAQGVLPFTADSSPRKCDNEGLTFTTHYSYGPWDDYPPTTDYSPYSTNQGMLCRVELNACGSDPCQNGATCTNVANSCFQCTCAAGFSGRQCEYTILSTTLNCNWLCTNTSTESCFCIVNLGTSQQSNYTQFCLAPNAKALCESDGAQYGSMHTQSEAMLLESEAYKLMLAQALSLYSNPQISILFGLQRSCPHNSTDYYSLQWVDNCMQPSANEFTDFSSISPNYNTGQWAATTQLPFGTYPEYTACGEYYAWYTHYYYGPWDDIPTNNPISYMPSVCGVWCRKERNPCGSTPCYNGGVCTKNQSCFTCDCTNTGYTGGQCDIELPTCDPVYLANGSITLLSGNTTNGNYTWSTTVDFVCNVDFVLVGAMSNECVNATWTQTTPSCQPAPACPLLAAIGNGTTTNSTGSSLSTAVTGWRNGSTMSFACNQDFVLVGAQTTVCVNGTWTSSPPVCQAAPVCPLLVTIGNGTTTNSTASSLSTAVTGWRNGSTMSFACNQDFVLVGAQSSVCVNGAWAPSLPICQAAPVCTLLAAIGNGTTTNSTSSSLSTAVTGWRNGSTMSFACNQDFVLVGAQTTVCVNGTWTSSPPVCQAAPVCPLVVTIGNGTTTNSTGSSLSTAANGWRNDSTMSFACNQDFVLVGAQSSVCINGAWTPSLPICQAAPVCPLLAAIGNGNTTNSTSSSLSTATIGWRNGSTMSFACNQDFVLVGAQTTVCVNGTWTSSPPVCQAAPVCPLVVTIGNGTTTNSTASSLSTAASGWRNDSTMSFACNQDFVLVGAQSSVCINGAWTPSLPSCQALPVCPLLAAISNGVTTNSTGSSLSTAALGWRNGSTMNFACNQNFSLVGVQTIVCISGAWSSAPPICQVLSLCGAPPAPPAGGNVSLSGLMSGGAYLNGSTAMYSCPPGYGVPSSPTITCLTNGQWSGPAPSCAGLCSSLYPGKGDIVNSVGVVTEPGSSNFVSGENYTLNCNPGMAVPTGLTTVVYTCDPVTLQWSPAPAECNLYCPTLNITNGFVWSYSMPTPVVGSVAYWACNPGYLATGDDPIICAASKAWPYSAPPTCTDLTSQLQNVSNSLATFVASEVPGLSPNTADVVALAATIADALPYVLDGLTPVQTQQLGYTLQDILIDCTFAGDVCKPSDIVFTQLDPQLGNCYTFNHKNMAVPYIESRPGEEQGVFIALNVRQEEYLNFVPSPGMRVIFHDADALIIPNVMGDDVAPGYLTQMRIYKTTINRISTPYSPCISDVSDLTLTTPFYYNGSYLPEACVRSIVQAAIVKTCGCASPLYALPPSNVAHSCQLDKCIS